MSSEQNNNDEPVIENTLIANNDTIPAYNENNTFPIEFDVSGNNTHEDDEPSAHISVSSSRRSSRTSTLSERQSPPPPPPSISSTLTRRIPVADSLDEIDWFAQREYIIFKNELTSQRKINNFILKECKENKRLLDLKCDDLTKTVNNIQTSVIFVSTLSGFLQATKTQFAIPSDIIEVISITISTYIALILSISKYYKLDELKEQIEARKGKYELI